MSVTEKNDKTSLEYPAMSIETFAKIMLDFTGDPCPCNFGDIAKWLNQVCEINKANGENCPCSNGIECWEQYIKHYEDRLQIWKQCIKEAIEILGTEKKCVLKADHATDPCDRDCANCVLVLPSIDIINAYNTAIDALDYLLVREDIGLN